MNLAGLMRHAREGLSHGDDQRVLIVAYDPPQAIAQVFDGLEQALRQGAVIGREQRHCVEHQAEFQFAHDVERGVALFGFESIKGHKQTMPVERGRVSCQPEMIGAAEQDEKHAN
jgi:hypothetical protein